MSTVNVASFEWVIEILHKANIRIVVGHNKPLDFQGNNREDHRVYRAGCDRFGKAVDIQWPTEKPCLQNAVKRHFGVRGGIIDGVPFMRKPFSPQDSMAIQVPAALQW